MKKTFRAPAVPLITHDPMFSMWSFSDKLTDDTIRHWDGRRRHMFGVLIIDNIVYNFMGKVHTEDHYHPGYRVMEQTGCEIRPMSTVYTFENELVNLELTFTSPLLLNDLMILSRPVSYISYRITPKDTAQHNIEVHFGFTAETCVNTNNQEVSFSVAPHSVYFSSGDENMLKRSGDGHRIEWGEFHVISPRTFVDVKPLYRYIEKLRLEYTNLKNYTNTLGTLSDLGPAGYARCAKTPVYPSYPIIISMAKFTTAGEEIKDFIGVGYNDFKSIQYFGENIEGYWRKNGDSFTGMLAKAYREYDEVMAKVKDFEEDLLAKARKISDKYADIVSANYRLAIAAHKLTWHDGEIQFFSKENYSNGCIATVDVTYPSVPLFLMYAPELVEGMLNPVFKLVYKGLWDYEFAPHDVGQYPIANGQIYGYEIGIRRLKDPIEYQMPVEECGNMLLCVASVCYAKKEFSYFEKHLDILKQWADYLVKIGYNPDNQLCTDDFAGHLAHNCNLSVKAICGLGVFAKMLKDTGKNEEAAYYRAKAEEMAAAWEKEAFDGDHYRLAFDQSGTWSMKYNMVWDKLLDMKLFSQQVYDLELQYYKTKMCAYGLPLDSRCDYTKTDWQMWSTVLFDDKEYTDMIVERMWNFMTDSPDRMPFSDWLFASYPKVRGFQARSVQGGLFINLLKF